MELYGTLGRWRCEEMEITAVRVLWDEYDGIVPLFMTNEDGFVYSLQVRKQYPMSTRKTDGAGRQYIVSGSCSDLGDHGRLFTLMLNEWKKTDEEKIKFRFNFADT